ncbi:MAG: ABC transporter permease [Armatimonadota bacterium]
MHRVIIRRLLTSIPLLLLVSIFSFYILRLAPGDPVRAYLAMPFDQASPELIAETRKALGLDKPLYVQYVRWLGGALSGNLGNSLMTRRPAATIIRETLPNTLRLMGLALLIGVTLGMTLGIIAALRPHSKIDLALSIATYVGNSIPAFWSALMLVFIFGVWLNWLPTVGMMSLRATGNTFIDRAAHLVLPVATLAFQDIVVWLRYQRNSLLEVLGEDYIRTARAKGLSESLVVLRHAWRNSLISVITLLGYSLPRLLTGAYIVETIFSWPGMGRLSVDAIYQRDYPVIMALLLVSSTMVVLGNLMADVGYALVDPRVRYEA